MTYRVLRFVLVGLFGVLRKDSILAPLSITGLLSCKEGERGKRGERGERREGSSKRPVKSGRRRQNGKRSVTSGWSAG